MELFDFYLKSSITTPAGSSDKIRITANPGGLSFFKPKVSPETDQGAAATYSFWPIKRELIRSSAKFANDKLVITASNVTTEYAQMLADLDWEGTPVIIRKVPVSSSSTLTADDCALIFSGTIDSVIVSNAVVQFTVSNDLAQFQTLLPRENMHEVCRFSWADDQCTAIRFKQENYKAKTTGSGCSTTRVVSSDFTEDTQGAPYTDAAVTVNASTDTISLASHQLHDNSLVKFSASVMPGGLTANTWYYAVDVWGGEFKVSLTEGGSAIDINSNGTSVTVSSNELYTRANDFTSAVPVTCNAGTNVVSGLGSTAGLVTGMKLRFGGTTVPSSLTRRTTYYPVNITATTFKVAATPEGTALLLGSAGTSVTVDWKAADLIAFVTDAAITASSEQSALSAQPVEQWYSSADVRYVFVIYKVIPDGTRVRFAGTVPAEITVGTYYYIYSTGGTYRYWLTTTATSAPSTNAVSRLSGSASVVGPGVTTYYTEGGGEACRVRDGMDGSWQFDNDSDWGTVTQGYWQIPDDQTGLKNAALKPYIQFDFGSAKQIFTWRLRGAGGSDRASLVRLIQIFSSADAATWNFESYFILPPRSGFFDCLIPSASSARYWRICVRTKWSDVLNKVCFESVRAFAYSRHWWRDGQITFDSSTATAALRGITRAVTESYAGEIRCATLPAAPANGDTFVIERGCPRTFNGCAMRQNTENFGGFESIPVETVVR